MPPLADLEYLVASSGATEASAEFWIIHPSEPMEVFPLSPSSTSATDDDLDDLEAAIEALKDERRVPWEQVKRRLGL